MRSKSVERLLRGVTRGLVFFTLVVGVDSVDGIQPG
jgi:hypothetical protein